MGDLVIAGGKMELETLVNIHISAAKIGWLHTNLAFLRQVITSGGSCEETCGWLLVDASQ